MKDGTLAPLEYKFAEYKQKLFQLYKCQLVMQGLLIQANYQRIVQRGFLVFIRSQHKLLVIEFSAEYFKKVETILARIVYIVQTGFYPAGTRSTRRCIDCCYKNICV